MAKRLTYFVELKRLDGKDPWLIFTSKSKDACQAIIDLILPTMGTTMVIVSQGTSWRRSSMIAIYRHKQRNIKFTKPVKWRREKHA